MYHSFFLIHLQLQGSPQSTSIGRGQPGESAWGTEIITDRAMAVESEIVRARDAMKYDTKILLRRVLASHIPEPTQFTQAHWVCSQDALDNGILCQRCVNGRRAMGLPALENNKFADSANTSDYGFVQAQSGRCFKCCALYQALYYLGQTSNSGNPSEAETCDRVLGQQKELAGAILALMDQNMLNSPIARNLVSPDEDMREWVVVAYSSVNPNGEGCVKLGLC